MSELNKVTVIEDDPFHCWFGLTYASYLVLPRLLLESMPRRWQLKMIALINQMPNTLDLPEETPNYQVSAKKKGKFIRDRYRDYRHAAKIPMRVKDE